MKEDSPEKLVTVAVFSAPIEAHLARTRLESAGIETFLEDEHVASLDLFFSSVIGGIKLQVVRSEADSAVKILGLERPATYPEEEGEQYAPGGQTAPVRETDPAWQAGSAHGPGSCPVCGSTEFRPPGLAAQIAASLLQPFYKTKIECARCAHEYDK